MRWKPLIFAAAGATVAAAWAAVAVTYFLGFKVGAWTVIVTIAALTTEAAFWVSAAVLGVTVIQARNDIWRWLTRPLRIHVRTQQGAREATGAERNRHTPWRAQ
jgi:hypothetical protein